MFTTGKTPYEIVFGTKPQIPMSLKLGLYRNKHRLCCSEFCKDLPSQSHGENNLKNQLLDNLLRPQLSHALLERKDNSKLRLSQIQLASYHKYSKTIPNCVLAKFQSHLIEKF